MTPQRERVPLRELTTFRIGGPCDSLYVPGNTEQAVTLLRTLQKPIILGRGSNVLAADAGLRSPVVLTSGLNGIHIEGETVRAGCGVSLPELSQAAAKASLSGLEWAGGIPGSLGGAVVMNAGAYGGVMDGVVTEALCFDGEKTFTVTEFDFGYRHSVFHEMPDMAVLEVTLKLTSGDGSEIRAKTEELKKARSQKQPVNQPSAGSFFKRPPGRFAGALIEQCGLKGVSVGGAQVSEKHAGFIVNTGGATCDDVMRLADLVRGRVYKETGAELVPEVRLLGDIQWSF